MTAWAAAQVAQLDTDALPSSAAELTAAANKLLDAEQSLDEREQQLRAARTGYTTAVKDAEQSGGEHRRLLARLAELEAGVDRSATGREANALSHRCDELEAAMIQAAESLRKARTRWREIDVERNRLQRKADATRAQLRDVRDTLVPLHAPQVDDTNIEGAWALLTAWAGQQATIRARMILEAADAAAVANADRNSRIGSLTAELLVNDIDLPDDNVAAAASLVAVALERARGQTEQHRRRSAAGGESDPPDPGGRRGPAGSEAARGSVAVQQVSAMAGRGGARRIGRRRLRLPRSNCPAASST